MIPAAIDAIANEHIKKHIQSLLDNAVAESRTIEYKQALPKKGDGKRDVEPDHNNKEFLADVSAFANTIGGDLIYGVAEKEGKPTEITGLPDFNADNEKARLEQVLQNGVAPRIPGVGFHSVEIEDGKHVLVVRIPKSWSAPHMVTHSGSSRFFMRNSNGKYQMDVDQIRSAFALAESLPERIRAWRDDRLEKIQAGDTPVPIAQGAKFVLHLIPLDSFANPSRLAPADLYNNKSADFSPIRCNKTRDKRINLDGYLTHDGSDPMNHFSAAVSYCQVFRSGCVENVSTRLLDQERRIIGAYRYEMEVVNTTWRHSQSLAALDVPYPVVVLLSLLDAKGVYMINKMDSDRYLEPNYPIDQDVIRLPDVLLEEAPADLPRALRPMFDALWNACGMARSRNYDDQGNWKDDRDLPLDKTVPRQKIE